ncbi:unnamed protein product [Amoebophrya sp. A25]|nr:unnamed protein product [Amoebophrya sp. A25]|eukprot:GSA25T00008442001.1
MVVRDDYEQRSFLQAPRSTEAPFPPEQFQQGQPAAVGGPGGQVRYQEVNPALWTLGIGLNALSSFMCTLGLVIQKYSTFTSVERKKEVWGLGFSLFIAGQIFMPATLTMAPQSVLSALTPISLVSNSILSPIILGEAFTRYHLASILFIASGCLIVVLFGPNPEDFQMARMDLPRLTYLSSRPVFLVLVAASFLVVMSIAIPLTRWRASGQPLTALSLMVTPVQLMLLSQIGGAICVTNTKTISTLFKDSFLASPEAKDCPNCLGALMRWTFCSAPGITVILIAAFGIIGLSLFSVGLLNFCVLLFPSLTTVTYDVGFGLIMQLIYGAVYFEEYKNFNLRSGLASIVGICCSLLGIYSVWLHAKQEEMQMLWASKNALDKDMSASNLVDKGKGSRSNYGAITCSKKKMGSLSK